MTTTRPASFLACIAAIDPDAPWAEIAPMLLPVLRRSWHPYPPDAAPLQLHLPPGIWTGFGIDVGPAFVHVSASMVERWGVDHATLLATSLENLRRSIEHEPPEIQRFEFAGATLTAIQGRGWGSSLLLLPDALRPILGVAPSLLLAPVRNTLIALPERADADLVAEVWRALADGAHDGLDVEPLRWTGTSVVAVDDRSRGLAN